MDASYWKASPQLVAGHARDEAEEAVRLKSGVAEGHTALGGVYLFYDWRWEKARAELEKATDLGTRDATPHQWLADYYVRQRKWDAADRRLVEAERIAPRSNAVRLARGRYYYYKRTFDKAITTFKQILNEDKVPAASLWLGKSLVMQRKLNAAVAEFKNAGGEGGADANLAYCQAASHQPVRVANARQILHKIAKTADSSPFDVAKISLALGDIQQVELSMKAALERRSPDLVFLRVDPLFGALRSKPWFEKLLNSIDGRSIPGVLHDRS